MAGIISIKELDARKQALAAESEAYRQMLLVEVQNLRLYRERVRRKLGWYQAYVPMMKFGVPLLLPLLRMAMGRREQKPKSAPSRFRIFTSALAAWRLYRRFAPMLGTAMMLIKARRGRQIPAQQSQDPLMPMGTF